MFRGNDMRLGYLVTGLVIALVPACASSTSQTEKPTESQIAEQLKDAGHICRRTNVMGQIKPVRICMSPEEWEAQSNAQSENVRNSGRDIRQGSNQSN
jgi:hypothetical protein